MIPVLSTSKLEIYSNMLTTDNTKHRFKNSKINKYRSTVNKLISKVSRQKNKKRTIENYLFGSTCFVGPTPRYFHEDRCKYEMIPRPYRDFKLNYIVHDI